MKKLILLILVLCSVGWAAQSLTVIYHRNQKMASVNIDGKYYLTDFGPEDTNEMVIQKILAVPDMNEPNLPGEQMQMTVDDAIDVLLNADLSKENTQRLESLNTKVDSAITAKTQDAGGITDAK